MIYLLTKHKKYFEFELSIFLHEEYLDITMNSKHVDYTV